MSDWSLNDLPLLRAQLVAPLTGRWTADLEVDTDTDITGPVVLTIGAVQRRGTVFRGGLDEGKWCGRIVGGANGLDRPVTARSWQGSQSARGLVTELLRELGEVLSDSSGPELDTNIPRWSRIDGPGHHALADLVRAVGARWRITPEGAVWIGTESWPELITPEGDLTELLEVDPRAGSSTFAVSSGYVLPGQTFEGLRVGGLVYSLDDGHDRVTVWSAPP